MTRRAAGLLQGIGIDVIDSPGFLKFLSQREFPRSSSNQLPPLLSIEVHPRVRPCPS